MAIFMIGTQRSGSNLLRLMLNQLPGIAAPHPPHILQRIMPLMDRYGDLQNDDNFMMLVNDVCQLVELNPVPWEGVTLSRSAIVNQATARTLLGVYEAVYNQILRVKGAREWCCKSLANINFLPQIESHFRNARYIYLYRDGRDVAVSFRKAIVGEKHFYHIAQEWAQTQRLALAMEPHIGPKRFFRVKYEQLIANPEFIMTQLCRFLDVEFSPTMLAFHETDEARRAAASSTLWGNVTQPIMASNTGKYLREASEDDIRIFESVAGRVLDTLGYARSVVPAGKEIHYRSNEVKIFDAENARLKQETQAQQDSSDLQRRDLQSSFISRISRRNVMTSDILTRLDQPH
jgi:hypothetical protein